MTLSSTALVQGFFPFSVCLASHCRNLTASILSRYTLEGRGPSLGVTAVLCRNDRCLQSRYHSQCTRQLPQFALEYHQILGKCTRIISCFSLWHPSWLPFLIPWAMECSSAEQVLSLDGNFLWVALLVSPNLKML